MKLNIKHYIEFIIITILGRLLRILPLRMALSLGWLIALTSHYLFCFRRKEAKKRIRQVFGENITEAKVNDIAWASWRNMCLNVVEILRFNKLTKNKIPAKDNIKDFMYTLENTLGNSQNGVVLATIHMGNWELAGIAIDLNNLPIFSIARRQKNPLTDGYINHMRSSFNMKVLLNDKNIYREIIRRLKKNNIFAILPDVRNPNSSQSISFLGFDANLGSGAASFARKCNCTIQPMITYRVGLSQHSFKLLKPIKPELEKDKKEDNKRMMNDLMAQFTEVIKVHPEQYFWYNKRWVLDPI
tara:strand:+ start:686 stop:1585 length:900 start_codon:yes stop_codon:yes gene_type:complete